MLKVQCPVCRKSFIWTDDMPVRGKCPHTGCDAAYDIHSALKQNVNAAAKQVKKNVLLCPSCGKEISSGLAVCRDCGNIVLGSKFFKKSYFFAALCIFLLGLSLILKYLVK